MTTLAQAMAIVRAADAEAKARLEMHEVAKGVDWAAEARRGRSEPSMSAAQSPANRAAAERQEKARLEALAREQAQQEQLGPSREELIKRLGAGQAPSAQAEVRASILNGA